MCRQAKEMLAKTQYAAMFDCYTWSGVGCFCSSVAVDTEVITQNQTGRTRTPYSATYNDTISYGAKIGLIWVLAQLQALMLCEHCTLQTCNVAQMQSATSERFASKTQVDPIFCPSLIEYGGKSRFSLFNSVGDNKFCKELWGYSEIILWQHTLILHAVITK